MGGQPRFGQEGEVQWGLAGTLISEMLFYEDLNITPINRHEENKNCIPTQKYALAMKKHQ